MTDHVSVSGFSLFLALLFLCLFLGRTNVGNAKVYGLENDIHITDDQYDRGLVVYYAMYRSMIRKLASSNKRWIVSCRVIWC